jgi:hypothetical protein
MQEATRPTLALVLGAAALVSAALLSAGLVGCAAGAGSLTSGIVASAKDLPDHFLVPVSGLAQAEEPKAGEGCRNPMIDPRNGTTLNLMRSKDGVGDYQVMGEQYSLASRYGVDSRHYLRVDCATGKGLGIVEP